MEKEITVKQFAEELIQRIDKNRDIDCCRVEIKRLAEMAGREIADKKIRVQWKE
jgi:hypothetical protein